MLKSTINDKEIYIEAYHSQENERILSENDVQNFKNLKWYSIGYPVLIENEVSTLNSSKTLFRLTENKAYASVQMLTIQQKELFVKQIKETRKVDVLIDQIEEFKLSKFYCEYNYTLEDVAIGLKGSINFSKPILDPYFLEIEPFNNSNELRLFKNYLLNKTNEKSIEFVCMIQSKEYGFEKSNFLLKSFMNIKVLTLLRLFLI